MIYYLRVVRVPNKDDTRIPIWVVSEIRDNPQLELKV